MPEITWALFRQQVTACQLCPLYEYKENLPLAIVEAKDDSHLVGDGMLQAQEYADKLDVRFVFTSNGDGFFVL